MDVMLLLTSSYDVAMRIVCLIIFDVVVMFVIRFNNLICHSIQQPNEIIYETKDRKREAGGTARANERAAGGGAAMPIEYDGNNDGLSASLPPRSSSVLLVLLPYPMPCMPASQPSYPFWHDHGNSEIQPLPDHLTIIACMHTIAAATLLVLSA